MVLLLSALAAGCGGGGDSGRDPVLGTGGAGAGGAGAIPGAPAGAIAPGAACSAATGPTIPTVTASDPTNGNQFVTVSTRGVAGGGKLITATFSLAMNPATINATTFTLAPVGGAVVTPLVPVSYNASTNVATLTVPALTPNTSYTAVLAGGTIMAANGNALPCTYAWNFKTAPPPPVAGAAPVNLGRATPFAIAARAGVTNANAVPPDTNTAINGNVVLHPTATCNGVAVDAAGGFGNCNAAGGFLAPTLSGASQVISPLFPDAGVTSGAIMIDLRAAYDSITPANLPGGTPLGCATIGTGGGAGAGVGCAGNATLAPGVYTSSGPSIGVTGTLTLDGGGDTNSRFIFQAASTVTTAAAAIPRVAASQIVLTNGAKASNVFWQVGSSATIGTYSIFQGNVLADTTISMGTGATSSVRLLAGAVTGTGQFTFDANVVSVPGNVNAPASCQ
jgi:hypothetical protein